ncbi:MAG: hypothetical protein H7Z12_13065 [Rhodospirillaceae bacterium]|nr:hypothetical protein [Rhodospirillales bacterium]
MLSGVGGRVERTRGLNTMANSNIAMGNGIDALDGGNGNDLLIAEPLNFSAPLNALNNSGVTGQVQVSVSGDELRVQVDATGLEANQPHAMHIHGLSGAGAPLDSSTPGTDTDGDGFIELQETARSIGPQLLALEPVPTTADGSIAFDQTYSLSGLANAVDLFPLDFRQIELHGDSVGASAGYEPTLPVALAELQFQPLQTFAAQGDQGITMSGGNGNDRVIGGHGNDIMNGGNGADVLAGGAGDDDLVGGRGADRFVVGQGKEVITDFNAAEGDRLVFGHDSVSPALVLHDTQQGTWIIEGSAAVTDPNSEGVLLLGVHAATVVEASHWFA